MNKLTLPIGESSFREMRVRNCYYVDKTPHIKRLIDGGKYYFLSRPRRFGKSLLVSTMKELFEGNEELFRGLYVHDRWDWTVSNPVVRLSFDANYSKPSSLEIHIANQLSALEEDAGIEPLAMDITGDVRLQNLVRRLNRKTGQQVVILVDEYDKPILDVLEDKALARSNRDYLKGLYGVIKGCADEVRFVFVTGVSMFSKVSLFSGLNNLDNISLNPKYATICGYTEADLDAVFAPELEGLDRSEIRRWYNGYNWRGEDKVYNPFDILLLFNSREFEPYWFETGSPKFLYRQLMDKEVSLMELEGRMIDKVQVSKFDVGDIGVEALLFQTGYLTIAEERRVGSDTLYKLDYPNFEVRKSLSSGLMDYFGESLVEVSRQGRQLCELLGSNEFERFGEQLQWFVSGMPYQWRTKDVLVRYEAWYVGLLYACFRTAGVDFRVEDASSQGRADLVVLHGGQVFVLELKVAAGEDEVEAKFEETMVQMRERGYADKYRIRGEVIYHLAVVFIRGEKIRVTIRTERV